MGLLYGASSYATYRLALHRPDRKFIALVLGGVMVRMFVALVVMTMIIALAPVDIAPLVGAFFAVFLVGLLVEIFVIHRRQTAASTTRS